MILDKGSHAYVAGHLDMWAPGSGLVDDEG
jgi:hypothetical protein